MHWLERVFPSGSVSSGLAILSLTIVLGLILGSIKVRGVSFGVVAVLFVALAMSWLGLTIEDSVLGFMRDFAMILFIYPIGLQVGPSFFSSLRAEGLRLNLFGLLAVALGAIFTVIIVLGADLPRELAHGLYTGGFATTPAFAAGEEAIRDKLSSAESRAAALQLASSVYAAAYPFGLLGPILLVLLFRIMFRANVDKELASLREAELAKRPPIETMDIEVTRPELEGTLVKDHTVLQTHRLVLSRVQRDNVITVPNANTQIHVGDIYRVVGPRQSLDKLVEYAGRKRAMDVKTAVSDVVREVIAFTDKQNLGKSLRELDLTKRFGVTIARVTRAGIDLSPTASLRLRFADQLVVIGPSAGVQGAAVELGNSVEQLNRSQLIPIFLGIGLGVLVGSIPFALPGLSSGMRIGLAGGPMLVAIVLSRLGHAGRTVFYMPDSAMSFLRDFGMAVFLACVGLRSGAQFFDLILHGNGLALMGWAAIVTLAPMLIVGFLARWTCKMNYLTICGLTAGAMTSSPTLLFTNEYSKSNVASVAYATVYPLAMLGPVFFTQLIVALLL